MSYDFLMFKLKHEISACEGVTEEATMPIGLGSEIKAQLSLLFPSTEWRFAHDYWWGRYHAEDTWYEFSIEDKETICFAVRTSLRAGKREAIKLICDFLGVVAFDGQAGTLIGSLSPRSV